MLTHGQAPHFAPRLVEQLPTPPPPVKRQRGRQERYFEKLFVKAVVVMIIRQLYTAWALLAFLQQDDPVAQESSLATEHGRFPRVGPGQRRFAALPAPLPALIGCRARCGDAGAALGSPRARGRDRQHAPARQRGVWHKKDRLAGVSQSSDRYRNHLESIGLSWLVVRLGSCLWPSSSAASASPWRRSSPWRASPTVWSRRCCWRNCR